MEEMENAGHMVKLMMMIGIPGSGKSTYAEQIARQENAVVLSSDKLREELFGDVWEIRRNSVLFSELFRRARRYLSQGKSIVLDATNIDRHQRRHVLVKFQEAYKECYYVRIPLELALYQNSHRDRNVPEEIIRKMYEKLQEPDYSEGWNKITIIEKEKK